MKKVYKYLAVALVLGLSACSNDTTGTADPELKLGVSKNEVAIAIDSWSASVKVTPDGEGAVVTSYIIANFDLIAEEDQLLVEEVIGTESDQIYLIKNSLKDTTGLFSMKVIVADSTDSIGMEILIEVVEELSFQKSRLKSSINGTKGQASVINIADSIDITPAQIIKDTSVIDSIILDTIPVIDTLIDTIIGVDTTYKYLPVIGEIIGVDTTYDSLIVVADSFYVDTSILNDDFLYAMLGTAIVEVNSTWQLVDKVFYKTYTDSFSVLDSSLFDIFAVYNSLFTVTSDNVNDSVKLSGFSTSYFLTGELVSLNSSKFSSVSHGSTLDTTLTASMLRDSAITQIGDTILIENKGDQFYMELGNDRGYATLVIGSIDSTDEKISRIEFEYKYATKQ
jgi:hypothetical protein